ncbi:MAG: purine-nucleoside phosphorylase [Limisphaerales bacterium]
MQKATRPSPRVKPRRQNRMPLPAPAATAALIRREYGATARLAIVLGSGFHPVLAAAEERNSIPYLRLPGFAVPAVEQHAGSLVFGKLGGMPVLILAGRVHYYEGFDLATVTFPMRVLAELGVQAVLLTNAAGAINPRFRVGELMLIEDHINFMGANPLRGTRPPGRERFVDLSQVYDAGLRRLLRASARQQRIVLRRGTYLAVAGPSYETPAEIRAFGRLGADAVGMSTVPEAIVARQCGLRVAALSCLTNLAAGRTSETLSHDEVLATGARSGRTAIRLLTGLAGLLPREIGAL